MMHRLIRTLLVGPASTESKFAGQALRNERDLSHFETAIRGLSTVMLQEDTLPQETKSSFDTACTLFLRGSDSDQTSEIDQRIIQYRLASIVSGVPDEAWRSIARRFGELEGFSLKTGKSLSESWLPKIDLKGENAKRIGGVRALMPSVFEKLFSLTTLSDADTKDWSQLLVKSELLDAERITFVLSELDKSDSKYLTCSWEKGVDDDFVIQFDFSPRLKVTATILAYAIAKALRSDKVRSIDLHKKHLKIDHQSLLYMEGSAIFEKRFNSPLISKKADDMIIDIQKILASQEERGKIKEGLLAMQMPQKMIDYLLDRLSSMRLSLHINLNILKTGLSDAVSTTFARNTLFIDISSSQSELLKLSSSQMWVLIARTFSIWVESGGCAGKRKTYFQTNKPCIAMPAQAIIFSKKSPTISSHPDIPDELVNEYVQLLNWIEAIHKRDTRKLPGTTELKPFLKKVGLLKPESYLPRISALQWIGNRRARNIVLSQASARGGFCKGIIYENISDLALLPPMEMIEVVHVCQEIAKYKKDQFARHSLSPESVLSIKEDLKDKTDSSDGISEVLSGVRSFLPENPNRQNLWTWLRLIWNYEMLAMNPISRKGFHIIGEQKKVLGPDMGKAIRRIFLPLMQSGRLTNVEKRVFIVDYAKIYSEPEKVTKNENITFLNTILPKREAKKLSILVASNATLMHFDGIPALDEHRWDLCMRLALTAPEGLSWITLGSSIETNRPELIAEVGEESWFALNKHYVNSTFEKRNQYRNALKIFRTLAQENDLSLPDPQSSYQEIRAIFREFVKRYHPDIRGADKDVEGIFNNIHRAFEILKLFHPENGS
ncbi:MAG: DnaJ domain-containing protein [Pseudomonadota bacterium]